MPWFAVRMIYEHSRRFKERVFEERIVLFQAADVEAVRALALEESAKYLSVNPSFKRSKNIAAFSIGERGSSLDGQEIWSHLLVAPQNLEEFVRQRYEEPVRDV
jgi:hypothetical protein